MKLTGNTRRHRWVAALTTSVLVITAGAALADNIVVTEKPATLTVGTPLSVSYYLEATQSNGCDAPVSVTLSAWRNTTGSTYVAATASEFTISDVTLDFTACGTSAAIAVDIEAKIAGKFQVRIAAPTGHNVSPGEYTVEASVSSGGTTDTIAPGFVCDPLAADSVWHADNQSHDCTATDATGVAATSDVAADGSFTLVTSVADGAETNNASTNSVLLCDTVTPVANCTTAGPISGWKIDRKAPTAIAFQNAPTTLVLGSTFPSVTCSATDLGSGVASCVVTGQDSSTVGSKTLTATATDNVGNESTATHNYSVIYDWTGFLRPVDNLPMLNTVKAGSAVPVKFQLGGDQGFGIMAAGYPRSIVAACDASAGTDAIEETATAGQSTLQYDTATGTYNYVWKTDKAWAGSCRQLQVKLIDGTFHAANFKLTK